VCGKCDFDLVVSPPPSLSPSDNKILPERNCSYKKLAFRINVREAYTHIFHPRLHSYWSSPSVCQGRVAPIFAAPKVRARACLCTNATATIMLYEAHSMGLQGCIERREESALFFLIMPSELCLHHCVLIESSFSMFTPLNGSLNDVGINVTRHFIVIVYI
jgi:hypothetical protein